MKVVVGITGASGVIYAKRFLEVFEGEKIVIVSDSARKVIEYELGNFNIEDFAEKVYNDDEIDAPLASGSYIFDAMVIIPASMNTVGKIANGIADTLISRVANVALKERRKLIVVFRESPLSTINLRNLLTISECGGIIVPASPAFYYNPKKIDDMVDYVVDKVLKALGINKNLISPWFPPSRFSP